MPTGVYDRSKAKQPTRNIRPIYVEPFSGIAVVDLSKGQRTFIDVESIPAVERWNWSACWQHDGYRAVRSCKAAHTLRGRTNVYLSRAVWEYHNGPTPEGFEVEHRNGNPLDNRLDNLRLATHSQNMLNVRRHRDTASGLKGAYRTHKSCEKPWRSVIKANGRNHWLGYFNTAEEAHAAYCQASRELHGEFGRTE